MKNAAFGSGSGSSWICILLALLDSDPDPHIVKVLDPNPDPYIEYTDPQQCFLPKSITLSSVPESSKVLHHNNY